MALLGLTACRSEAPAKREQRSVAVMVVAPATEGARADFPGEIKSSYESQLGFQVAGRVVAREINAGDTVRAGQTLFRLDPSDYARALEAASAQTMAAKSAAATQQADLARSRELLGQGFISRAEFEQKMSARDQASAQLRASNAQTSTAAAQVGRTTLRAPRAAVVTQIQGETGQVVAAGQSVVTLADPTRPEISVALPEGGLAVVQRARRLTVSSWSNPTRRYEARLRTLAGAADPATRSFAARVSIFGSDATLRMGETAELHVEGAPRAGGITVPLTAIARGGGGAQVWVLDRRTMIVKPRRVRIGAPAGDAVLVRGGLAAGETIVTAGVHLLRAGEKVGIAQVPTS